ncbi:hypothetical protein LXL04_005032 [Taraxacum kok-saghyz]
MKNSSRSILSPARARDPPPISLSNSRSRNLRNSCSIKGGGASPAMFPTTTGKRRGSGFENPEPSSPKVTCIGQVRVKSKKKQAKNLSAGRCTGKNVYELCFQHAFSSLFLIGSPMPISNAYDYDYDYDRGAMICKVVGGGLWWSHRMEQRGSGWDLLAEVNARKWR